MARGVKPWATAAGPEGGVLRPQGRKVANGLEAEAGKDGSRLTSSDPLASDGPSTGLLRPLLSVRRTGR